MKKFSRPHIKEAFFIAITLVATSPVIVAQGVEIDFVADQEAPANAEPAKKVKQKPAEENLEGLFFYQGGVDKTPSANKATGNTSNRNLIGEDTEPAAVDPAPLARKTTIPTDSNIMYFDKADSVAKQPSKKNTANDFGAIIKQLFPDAKLEIVPIQDSAIFLRGTVGTAEEVEQVEKIAEEFWPSVHNYVKSKETLRGAMTNPMRSSGIRQKNGAVYGLRADTPDGTVIGILGPPHLPNPTPANTPNRAPVPPAQQSAANPPAPGSPASRFRAPVDKLRLPMQYSQQQASSPKPAEAKPLQPQYTLRGPNRMVAPASGQPAYALRSTQNSPRSVQTIQADVRALHKDVKRLIDLLEKREKSKQKNSSKDPKTSQIPKQGKAVLFFTADWCGPCQTMQPIVQKLTREGYSIFSVDINKDQKLAREYEITVLPTFLQINNGKLVPGSRHMGALGEAEIRKFVGEIANSNSGYDAFAPAEKKSPNLDPFSSSEAAMSEAANDPFAPDEAKGAELDPFSTSKETKSEAANDPFQYLGKTGKEITERIFQDLRNGLVKIEVRADKNGESDTKNATLHYGTGCVLEVSKDQNNTDDPYDYAFILTSALGLKDQGGHPSIRVSFPNQNGEGIVYEGGKVEVVGSKTSPNLAALKVKLAPNHKPSILHTFTKKQELKIGQPTGWWGFGLKAEETMCLSGEIASIDKYEGFSNFQISGAIARRGMTGAPVTNEKGEVTGIVVAVDAQNHETVCTHAGVVLQFLDYYNVPYSLKKSNEVSLHQEEPVPNPLPVY